MSNGIVKIEDLRPKASRFDWEKVWGMFTEREAKRLRRLIAKKDGAAVRTYIINAIGRSGRPLAYFQFREREKIVASL